MLKNQYFKNTWLMLILFFLIPFGNIYGEADPFKDIEGHWAEEDIQEWLDKGIITGYPDQTFRPNNVISRGEFVALVNRAFRYSDMSPISFKDIKQTDWVYQEVQKAIAQGYINGFDDNTFRSNQQINRQETAMILSNILKLNAPGSTTPITLTDSNVIPSWSKMAINNIVSKGIMDKYQDGTFQPLRQMTRAESVVAIKKTLAASTIIYDKAGTFSETSLNTVHSDVIIQSSDVTLQNMHILGDLIISKEIGDGNFYMDQVEVDGITRIEGGGVNSIHIRNSQLGTVIVNKSENAVRVVAEGTTRIQNTQILSSANIEEMNMSGEGFIDLTVLPETKETKARHITIAGDFNNISLNGNIHKFTINSGNIKSLLIKEKLVILSVFLNKDVIVQKLDLNSKSTISGDGRINEIMLSDDAKDSVLPKEKSPTTPFFGGGGGGGGGIPMPESPALAVTSINAANGTVEVLFNKILTGSPEASDFTVLKKTNNGVFQKTDVSLVSLKADKTTVKLTVAPTVNTDEDQVIIYSVSYKNAKALLSQAFTVTQAKTTVTGSLFYLKYDEITPRPIMMYGIRLEGVNETSGTYITETNKSGSFTFNMVPPGTYIVNIYLGLVRYYTDEFTVEAGQRLTLPDIIIEENAPLPTVEKVVFADIGYISGSVFDLSKPFSVKVELEDGTVLNSLPGQFDTFFSFNLYDYNPDLVLNKNDKLFVTLFAKDGWISERFEVNVVERPKTKSPNVTSVVYDDTRYVRGTVEDWANEITITKMDGTLIGRYYNNLGNGFGVYLFESYPLTSGEQILVYAQADGKSISDPAKVEVVAPTVVTSPPTIDAILYETSYYLSGKAEGDSIIVVKRADGTVIGEGKANSQQYGGDFSIQLLAPTIAGETLYISAKGYEKIISESLAKVVQSRAITSTPEIYGEVYSDFTYIHVTNITNPQLILYLKDVDGTVIAESYLAFDGTITFWDLELTPDAQYQLTAVAPEMKESAPFIFTAIAPTILTSIPTITVPVYADANYRLVGIAEPFAMVHIYYEDSTFNYSIEANQLGEFSFQMPSYPAVLPGETIMIRADAKGKLISEALMLTATTPLEKTSSPVVNDQIYGYTNELKGTAAKSTLIKLFAEDGSQIATGVYSDMNTGKWTIGLWYTILRGGERIYIIADEAGKLPSDPVYITIHAAPKSLVPIVTSTVSAQSSQIQGTYEGTRIINNMVTAIFLVNEDNQVMGMDIVKSDGSFSIHVSSDVLTAGQKVKIIAREGQKEASDPLVITVN
ncbi:S-layer homology domain-containing protein [Paenibacillus eucommiae]|uniref:SLH domain-containing protein n=1 Tax=Paenibacillus eucommiae TaxID=1355755 RepID=A0ABS4IVM1_9BACL|nr:S-layer homology domain-containing protein [Paenibacillus eucommiae]MBP1991629.1 hypothetical protein [Paenibacillus eucommiae]